MNIPTFNCNIIQFHLPDGKQTQEYIELPGIYESLYKDLLAHKCQLHAEMLNTGMVSITVSNGEKDLDYSITGNGPNVKSGLIKMLERKSWLAPKVEEIQ